jgi:hypothetical protein
MSEDIIVRGRKTIRFDSFLPDVRKELYLKHKYIARGVFSYAYFQIHDE